MFRPSQLRNKKQQESIHGNGSRIPKTLQAVFLASNRGRDVHKPPPEHVANKVFQGRVSGWGVRFPWNKKNRKNIIVVNNDVPREVLLGDKATFLSDTSKSKSFSQTVALQNDAISTIKVAPVIDPQSYLDNILRSRGYSTRRFITLQSGYYNKPTALQLASYSAHLISVAKETDITRFRHLMNCGLSPNPCNQFGESLVHNVCRRGDYQKLEILLELGCSVQVADDYGRTPMHDACWASRPSFETADLLLAADVRLLHMTDARGSTPLSYVHKDDWQAWKDYFEEKKDIFWPIRDLDRDGMQEPPLLCLKACDSSPLPDPINALPHSLAEMVATGKLTPYEVLVLKDDDESTVDDDQSYTSDDDSYDDEDNSETSFDMNDEEIAMIQNHAMHFK